MSSSIRSSSFVLAVVLNTVLRATVEVLGALLPSHIEFIVSKASFNRFKATALGVSSYCISF